MLHIRFNILLIFAILMLKNIIYGEQYFNSVGKNYSLVLVGGGLLDDNVEVWNKIIELGGGVGQARFGVISAASENPCCDDDSSWVYYRDLLTKYGANEVYYIPVTVDSKENNSNPEVIQHIHTLTGFFFGGGDQLRIIQSFYNGEATNIPSGVLQAIKETLFASGGVVAGTSAGTACQTSKTMITGGESYPALRNGSHIFYNTMELPESELLTGYGPGGVGLFTEGLLDSHFANRGRQGRFIKLLIDSRGIPTGSTQAFGIDENTAFVITGDWRNRIGTIIGQNGVWLFDTSEATIHRKTKDKQHFTNNNNTYNNNNNNNEIVNIENILLTRLSDGDVLDMNTYNIIYASYKQPIQELLSNIPETSNDIFQEDTFEFDKILISLLQSKAKSTYGTTKQENPQFIVTITKSCNSNNIDNKNNNNNSNDDDDNIEYVKTSCGYGGINTSSGLYSYGFKELLVSIDYI